ncbi:MAG: enoyl-CoA hydratase, partial [Gammaproteobacteria bacterium]|nr:enoyl-CoA hydratase [Gammaproteobacteria bacterium]
PAPELLPRALALATELAAGARAAFGATKRLLADSLGALESQMIRESETIATHAEAEEGREGIRAFLEKRAPRFPGAPAQQTED